MGLDDLLARLEWRDGTAGTADVPADVPANPLETPAGTAETAGTVDNDNGGSESSETAALDISQPIRATRWLLHYAGRDPMEVWFSPASDHCEVLIAYPEAVAAEPLPKVHTPVRTEVSRVVAARIPAIGCATCRHLKRSGLSAGYCGGWRDDLPGAYGVHHPLRKLPADQGAGCASYMPHEG